jgi:hypothetical protein
MVSDEPQHFTSVHFLLWTLEITMNNLVGVKVMHSRSNLFCPIDKSNWWNFFTILEQIVQWTVWAVFHDDTVAWGLCAHTPEI